MTDRDSVVNKKKPTPSLENQQMSVLSKIWEGESGYVFLPWIPADKATTEDGRKQNWHDGPAFLWPRDRDKVKEHVVTHAGDEQYFTPMKFKNPDAGRRPQNAHDTSALFADLDSVDPHNIPDDLVPSIAWETSPNSYQAVWLLQNPGTAREGELSHHGLNRRLTQHTGADSGGWYAGKPLRIPGSTHNKISPVPGRLLWKKPGAYTWEHLDEKIDPLPPRLQVKAEHLDDDLIDAVNVRDVIRRLAAGGMPRTSRKTLMDKVEPDKGERSEKMWGLAKDMAKAGATLVEVIALLQSSVWNKHAGQAEELHRLETLAVKAISDLSDTEAHRANLVENVEVPPMAAIARARVRSYMARRAAPPRWLVKGLIPNMGVGFIAGPPKNYKSWFSMDLAVSISSGQKVLDLPTRPGVVVVIQTEDSDSMVQERLDMIYAGKDDPEVDPSGQITVGRKNSHGVTTVNWTPQEDTSGELYMFVEPHFRLGDEGWMMWLEEVLEETNPDLVIIDNFISAAPAGIDMDKMNVKEVLEPLKVMATEFRTALGLIHHAPKGAADDAVGLLGSVAIHAWADWGIYFKGKYRSKPREDGSRTTTTRFFVENKFSASDTWKVNVSALDGGPEERIGNGDAEGIIRPRPGRWAPTVVVETDDDDQEGATDKQKPTVDERSAKQIATYADHHPTAEFKRDDVKIEAKGDKSIKAAYALAQNNGWIEVVTNEPGRATVYRLPRTRGGEPPSSS